jgi:hypothetical protein
MNRVMIVAVAATVCVSTLNCAKRSAPVLVPAPAVAPVARPVPADAPSLQDQIGRLRALQEAVKTRLLAVPPDEQTRLADFLKLPDTGLVKLLPRGKYDDTIVGLNGGGAYYSFARLTHEYGYGSDIELQDGRLTCGFAGSDYGYFLRLGDVPIAKAAAVAGAPPPEWAPPEAAERWGELWRDVPVENRVLWGREARELQRNPQGAMERGVPAQPGNTYLLRSVSPTRSDILVAFRVERAFEEDGSILISWKVLKDFPVANPRGLPLEAMKRNRGMPR